MSKKFKGLLLAFALGVQMTAPAAMCVAADDNATVVQCEDMTLSGQYTGKVYSPFTGVALYANNDKCSYTQYLGGGTHDFTLRGAANGSTRASVDLVIGGETKGTFYFSGTSATEYTISDVSHGTGNQTIQLVVTTDDGSWDAYVDALTISASGADSGSTGSGSTDSGNTGNTGSGNSGTTESVTETAVECEKMTISGQYAGSISSPFSGVALYANNDKCSYTHSFTGTTSDFTLRGAANASVTAKVDLMIGGEKKGTFQFTSAGAAVSTLSNVSHGTGNQTIELVVTTDDGSWDAYVDSLTISTKTAGGSDSGSTGGGNTGSGDSGNTGSGSTDSGNTGSDANAMECENMTVSGQYAGKISSPFSGVALYANNESCSYTQYFESGTHDFTLRGASNNSTTAQVDLVIGNETKGTFRFTSAGAANCTISNVSHGTGNQTIKLVVTTDDGSWDAYVDCLTISAAGSGSTGSGSGNTGSGSGSAGSGSSGSGSTVVVPSAAIPDPFVMNNGQVVSGMGDWQVRAEEIRDLYEENMYGVWRDGSDEKVTYSYSNGSLTINVRRLSTGKTTSFKATVNLPTGNSWNPAGGYPVIVGMHEGISEETATANGYAVITIDGYSYPVASDDTSHKGAFYDLYPYGSSASEQTGVLMAWAWGASKVLDALEAGAGDLLNINEENSIITGVSRWGKAASVCGAFETRFKMVAPSCSGAGGLAMFRYTSEGKTYDFSSKGASSSYTYGQNEPLGSLQSTSERGWFNDKFLTYSSVNQLPFDQHYLASLAADSDRYLFIIGSCVSEDWVNAPAMWFTYLATKEIYDYLGINDNIKINIHKEGHAVIEEDVKYMIQYFNQKVYGIQPSSNLSVLDTSVFALPQNWDTVWDAFNANWSVK